MSICSRPPGGISNPVAGIITPANALATNWYYGSTSWSTQYGSINDLSLSQSGQKGIAAPNFRTVVYWQDSTPAGNGTIGFYMDADGPYGDPGQLGYFNTLTISKTGQTLTAAAADDSGNATVGGRFFRFWVYNGAPMGQVAIIGSGPFSLTFTPP